MESLHKIDFEYCKKNPYDLIVVDECQANLSAHTCKETNGSKFNKNADTFYSMLRFSQRVLFCDAFINAKTLEFLTEFQLPTQLLAYKCPMKQREARLIEGDDFNSLLPYIAEDLTAGKRLYVCMSSADRGKTWADRLSKEFPDKKIRLYIRGEGKEISDVRTEWSALDVVITTTTITVGINFDIPHFHKCYMSFSSSSKNNVVDLFQCHYRVRHLIDNEIVVHIKDLPNNIEHTEREVCESLEWFEKHQIELFEFFKEAPLYLKKLLCCNQLERNLSVAKLTNLVYAFLYECNYRLTTESFTHEAIEMDEKEESTLPCFDKIKTLSECEYVTLNMERGRGAMLSQDQKDQLRKHEFVRFFSSGIDKDWVNTSYDEEFWKLFNSFKEAKLNRIKAEKRVQQGADHIEDLLLKEYHINYYGVMSSKRNSRVSKMIEFTNALGLQHSQDVGATVSKERLDAWCDIIRGDVSEIRKIFGLQDRRQSKGEMSNSNCVTLLNSILKEYGYTQITQKQRLITTDGKRHKDPNSPYEIQDYKTHLKIRGSLPRNRETRLRFNSRSFTRDKSTIVISPFEYKSNLVDMYTTQTSINSQ